MDISYFNEFVVLAETRNFWAASERLFIGQSSLSKHIKAMEKELGAPLFARTSRRVQLTEFGQLMLPYAQSIARLRDHYESVAYNYVNAEEQLNVACIPALAHYNITDTIIRFKQEHPNVQVNIEEADTLVIREWLLQRKCHLAIYRESEAYLEHDPDTERLITKLHYCDDPLVTVLPNDHPLAGENHIELKALAEDNFALIHPETMPYALSIRACREAGFLPKVLFTSHNLEAVLDMVRKGRCAALLFANHVNFPRNLPDDEQRPFSVVPITPEIHTTVCLSYLKDAELSPAVRDFIDYCINSKWA